MTARQLRLLPPPKPLTERLGRDFFLQVPREPGVYFMYDAAGRLIYIGQSHDLRDRLGSYRHVHPDRDSRKTIRLVHSVARIEWQLCATHAEAMAREVELLRAHRPRFNRADTFPPPHYYIGLRTEVGKLTLCLAREPIDDADATQFGPFNSWARHVYGALLRLLFVTTKPSVNVAEFPHGLLNDKPPRVFGFPVESQIGLSGEIHQRLADYFAWKSDEITTVFAEALRANPARAAFEKDLFNSDVLMLLEFHRRRPGS